MLLDAVALSRETRLIRCIAATRSTAIYNGTWLFSLIGSEKENGRKYMTNYAHKFDKLKEKTQIQQLRSLILNPYIVVDS